MGYDPKSKFDYACKEDKRVEGTSPYALRFPEDIGQAPESHGVYMLLDIIDYVLYVGASSGANLREAIKSKVGTAAEKEIRKYRWFKTSSEDIARELEAEWLKKFRPKNNQAEQEQSQQQSSGIGGAA